MSIRNLDTQVSQLANTVERLEAQGSGKLPSQTVINPKENICAISLRSGKQLDEVPLKAREAKEETKQQKDLSFEKHEATTPIESGGPPKKMSKDPIPPIVPALPLPSRFVKSKKEDNKKEIFDTF